ncbi:hypothetical protein AGMMS49938_19190 [Fibrobacterales bacterium]|nr:hypothetical protein AGMMS49938_19190 [Fibrobacterales bacterium]
MKKINCFVCSKNNLSKNEIGLNKKMIDRNIKLFYCIDCLASHFEVKTEDLLAKIQDFKEQGCDLF